MLRSVDQQKVIKFLKERLRHEVEVREKQKEAPSRKVASYKVSIECTLLGIMYFVSKFDGIALNKEIEELTSEHTEQFTCGIVLFRDGAGRSRLQGLQGFKPGENSQVATRTPFPTEPQVFHGRASVVSRSLSRKLKPYVRLLCENAVIQDKVKVRTINRNHNKT